jgi:DNA-binding NarL/FixJ family response regulator
MRGAGRRRASSAAPRLFVVSDMRLYRDFIVRELVLDATVELVGAAPAAEAAAQVVALRPDVLLLDTEAAGARQLPMGLRAYLPELRVVACGVSGKPQDQLAWLKAGVAECVREDSPLEKIVTAACRAWRDEILCPPALLALLPGGGAQVAGQGFVALRTAGLTARERQILNLVGAGLPNAEIARQLGLQPGTVKNHLHRMLRKLGMPRGR